MRTLMACVLAACLLGCGGQKEKATKNLDWYGASFDVPESPKSELTEAFDDGVSTDLLITAEIQQVCQMKGCWMNVKTADGNEMRVTFKDYGFFVPMEGIDGKTAILKGVCEKKETSVEDLRHYAMDAGQSEEEIAMITEPKLEFSFVASGVAIQE